MLTLELIHSFSSTTTAAGACTGLGIAPNRIKKVFGILKPIPHEQQRTFPTELFDDVGKRIAKIGNELEPPQEELDDADGLTVALKYTIRVNGVTQLMMMKGDVLSELTQSRFVINTNRARSNQPFSLRHQ